MLSLQNVVLLPNLKKNIIIFTIISFLSLPPPTPALNTLSRRWEWEHDTALTSDGVMVSDSSDHRNEAGDFFPLLLL